jgi:rRNA-processing protein FCF1|tara:strand:- start:992 stop:1402 length:411 start_codon:yes stop_codon:yes gene_type:complete
MAFDWPWNYFGVKLMNCVLIDACGWAALIDAGLNLDVAMSKVIGKPRYLLLEKVREELDSLAKHRKGLLLNLLDARVEIIEPPEDIRHTDGMLLHLSKSNGWPVLTVDRRLKERLMNNGGSYIEVTAKNVLRLIQN